MKRIRIFTIVISLSFALSAFTSCKSKDKKEDLISTDVVENPTKIEFKQDTYDFESIIQGEKVTHDFEFTNTGKNDLIITGARASCGCTVPDYPKEPIKPGDSGIIHVVFNSSGKHDAQNKTVTITANTNPNETKLYLKGIVVVPKNAEPATTNTTNEGNK